MRNAIILSVSIVVTLIFMACDNGNPASEDPKPFYSVYVTASDDYWDENNDKSITAQNITVTTYSYQSPKTSTLSLKLNDKQPDIVFSNTDNSYWWDCTISDGIFLNESFSGNKSLSVFSDFGKASAQITIPNPTVITSHNHRDTISPYSSIVVTWNGNAEWYAFQSTASDTDYNSTELYDTVVVGNSFTIPVNKITPNIARVNIEVTGANGPQPTPGIDGNISGDGRGFVFATNYSGNDEDRDITLYMRGRLGKALSKSAISENIYKPDGFQSFVNQELQR